VVVVEVVVGVVEVGVVVVVGVRVGVEGCDCSVTIKQNMLYVIGGDIIIALGIILLIVVYNVVLRSLRFFLNILSIFFVGKIIRILIIMIGEL